MEMPSRSAVATPPVVSSRNPRRRLLDLAGVGHGFADVEELTAGVVMTGAGVPREGSHEGDGELDGFVQASFFGFLLVDGVVKFPEPGVQEVRRGIDRDEAKAIVDCLVDQGCVDHDVFCLFSV